MFFQEKGFKEVINLCLQSERVFNQLDALLEKPLDADNALYCLLLITRLMNQLSRSDAKVLLIQTLTRYSRHLPITEDSHTIKQQCELCANKLAMGPRVLAAPLIQDPFLSQCYHQRIDIHHSALCDSWKSQAAYEIQLQLQYWLDKVKYVKKATTLILWLARERVFVEPILVQAGFYSKKDIKDILSLSLVRVKHEGDATLYPNISMAHRWLVITFFKGVWKEGAYRHIQMKEDIQCELHLCYEYSGN